MSVQRALSGTVVSTFYDGIVVKAFPSTRPVQNIPVTGNNVDRINIVRTRQPLHRTNQVNRQGLPILHVGDRQERKRSYFQYMTNKILRTDDTPTTRYSRMTAGQLSKAIQEADVRTLNGYALHKQLEGSKDCYLATHGTGICLKARQTLSMGDNDAPRNRWKYQGDVQQIALDDHVANMPLPHLIYGCEFEAKGKRFRVIDGSDPGEPPHETRGGGPRKQKSFNSYSC